LEIEAALIVVFLVLYLVGKGIKALFRLLTGAAQREREEQQQWLEELYRQEQKRQRQEELRRKVIEDAKQQFEQAVMVGCFPSEEVLAILDDCDSDIPVNLKEAVEELLYGRYSLDPMAFGDAVRLIQQRQRTEECAKARAARGDGHGSEPTGPVTQGEACELLGVSPGCTKEELAAAYRRRISQWHPDKLETMAQELKDYATRRTARINEAYERLKQLSAQAS
jgi:DnaJ domain